MEINDIQCSGSELMYKNTGAEELQRLGLWRLLPLHFPSRVSCHLKFVARLTMISYRTALKVSMFCRRRCSEMRLKELLLFWRFPKDCVPRRMTLPLLLKPALVDNLFYLHCVPDSGRRNPARRCHRYRQVSCL